MFRTSLVAAVASIIALLVPARGFTQGPVDPKVWESAHRDDIRQWSARSGLSAKAIKSLLQVIGPEDGVDDDGEGDPYSIQEIDARSLARRGQIFIALTGPATGHALAIYVVRAAPPHALVWDMENLEPHGTCPSETFATESVLGEATATVTSGREISVRIPLRNEQPDTDGEYKPYLLEARYAWNGKKYELRTERQFEHYQNGVASGTGVLLKCN